MSQVKIKLGSRSYLVHIGEGILRQAAALIPSLEKYSSVVLLTHPGLADYAREVLLGIQESGVRARTLTVTPGERHKTLNAAGRIYNRLLDLGVDRKSLLITVGGGVLGDVGGFVAATFLRGIDFIQVPTTLLAQVDASIGGKTGVDLPGGKNLVGSFHQPRAVIIDPQTLRSLPLRELRSGLAEVIKYGIIADKALFSRLSREMPLLLRRDSSVLASVIKRSCEINARVVAHDETEKGLRAVLNFGHTVGHALETLTVYRRYKHGEAISIGMVSAALIGEELRITPAEVTTEIAAILRAAKLPVSFTSDVPPESVLEAIKHDKKAAGGRAHFVLAREIGNVEHGIDVPETAVRSALLRQVEMG